MRIVNVRMRCVALIVGCAALSGLSRAGMIANPVGNIQRGHFEFGAIFNKSEVDYESDGFLYGMFGEAATTHRTGVGLYAALGLAARADMFLAASSITEASNLSDYAAHYSEDGGSGFTGQFGLRGELVQEGAFSVHIHWAI